MNPAFLQPTVKATEMSPTDLLALERLRNMQQHRQQRETAHMKKLMGTGAATTKRRLRLARILTSVGMTLGGAAVGGLAGWLSSRGRGGDHVGSAILDGATFGGGAGLLGAGLANLTGSTIADMSNVEDRDLAESLKNFGGYDYITPGKAAYLQTLLSKSQEENEGKEWRPDQYIV
jgi:hypothetical protein